MPLIILFVLFIVLPIAELYVIIQVGQAIGILPTIVILLLDGFLGAALARSQGQAAWRRFNEATAAGRVPAKEVFDGAAIVVGGAFLLAPGFITDVIGLSLLLPPTRALYGRVLSRAARLVGPARGLLFFYDRRPGAGAPGPRPGSGPGPTPRPPGPSPSPSPPSRRPSRSYDVEGSAREIPESQREIDRESDA